MSRIQDINSEKSLYQVLAKLANNIKVNINCIKIGEIVSFDKTDQTASVKVQHIIDDNYDMYMDGELQYPILQKVPVVIMGGGSTYISHPIAPGDQCLLVFCDYMIDSWWVSGEAKSSIVPRKHDISDPIAIVGLHPLTKLIQNYSDGLRLHYNDNSSIVLGETIDVNNATINLNGDTNTSGNASVLGNVAVAQNIAADGTITAPTLNATGAATGTFITADSKKVTVTNGIVVLIEQV